MVLQHLATSVCSRTWGSSFEGEELGMLRVQHVTSPNPDIRIPFIIASFLATNCLDLLWDGVGSSTLLEVHLRYEAFWRRPAWKFGWDTLGSRQGQRTTVGDIAGWDGSRPGTVGDRLSAG